MGKTIVEKILSAHTDTDNFEIGDIIKARVDFAFANDITAPIAIKYFKESGTRQVSVSYTHLTLPTTPYV